MGVRDDRWDNTERRGTIVGFEDPSQADKGQPVLNPDEPMGSWEYRIELDGEQVDVVSVPPDQIRLPAGTCVRVCGLNLPSEWNGQWGRVVGIDEAAGRYLVQIAPQQQIRVRFGKVHA